jgi:polyisoprenoid-binding protein YceI
MSRFVSRLRRLLPCLPALALFALACAVTEAPAAAQEWTVNKARSSVSVQISMDGQPVEGRFASYKMEILFDPEEPGDGKIAAVIDATSIRTGDAQRDAALFSPQWLNGGAYPDIRLASRTIKELDTGSYRMEADLTIRGVTKRVTVPLTVEDEGASGKIQAEVRASQAAFGIGGPGDEIALILDLTATHLTN